MVTKVNLRRRQLLVGGVAAGIAGTAAAAALHDGELGAPPQTIRGAVPWKEGTADAPPGATGSGYTYFTPVEATFVEAAVARLIPNDEVGPGAVEANVPFFLDRQLAGPFGRGDHYYLGGPWPKGTPEQGYQSRFSPAQLYRAAIARCGTPGGARHWHKLRDKNKQGGHASSCWAAQSLAVPTAKSLTRLITATRSVTEIAPLASRRLKRLLHFRTWS
jgi:gluconate 2-dehydrogenase gamma chain